MVRASDAAGQTDRVLGDGPVPTTDEAPTGQTQAFAVGRLIGDPAPATSRAMAWGGAREETGAPETAHELAEPRVARAHIETLVVAARIGRIHRPLKGSKRHAQSERQP